MSKFYVGATFTRYREARDLIDVLESMGHECVEDWTRCDQFGPDGELLPSNCDGYQMNDSWLPAAQREVEAVREVARHFGFCVFLGEQPSLGWSVELGMAIAFDVAEIYVIAPFKTTVFMALPNVFEVATKEEALGRLVDSDDDD